MSEYVSDEYVTAQCSTCAQPIYLARHRLQSRAWACPACGAANLSDETRQPVFTPTNRVPSRFGRASQPPQASNY